MFRRAAQRGHGQQIKHPYVYRRNRSDALPFGAALHPGTLGVVAPSYPHRRQADAMHSIPHLLQLTQSNAVAPPPAVPPERTPAAMAAVTETPPNPGSPDMHPCKTDNFGNRDILVGRGKMVNIHPGNIRFRVFVDSKKEFFQTCSLNVKRKICQSIVAAFLSTNPPYRFLDKDPKTGYWHECDEERIREKVSQKLRQGVAASRRAREASIALTLLRGGRVEQNSKSATVANIKCEGKKLFPMPSSLKMQDIDPKDFADLNAAFIMHFVEDPNLRALVLKSDPRMISKVLGEKECCETMTQNMSRGGVLTKNHSKRVTQKLPVKRTAPTCKHAATPINPSARLTLSVGLLLKSEVTGEKKCANMISQDVSRNDILTKKHRVSSELSAPASPPSKFMDAVTSIKPSAQLSPSTTSMSSDSRKNSMVPGGKASTDITQYLSRDDVRARFHLKRDMRRLPVKRALPPPKPAVTPVKPSARLSSPTANTETTELPKILGYQKNCLVKRLKKTDVVCEEGQKPEDHPGNIRFLKFVNSKTDLYIRSSPSEKPMILRSLVVALRSSYPPVRFLRRNSTKNKWQDIGNEEAEARIHQQLRECLQAKLVQEVTSEAHVMETNQKSTSSMDGLTNKILAPDSTRKGESYSSLELVFDVCLAKERLEEQNGERARKSKRKRSQGRI